MRSPTIITPNWSSRRHQHDYPAVNYRYKDKKIAKKQIRKTVYMALISVFISSELDIYRTAA